MCGITGIFIFTNKDLIDPDILVKMRDEMIHRGPDDFGLWISGDQKVGLAHRRLSIIDLSAIAKQPMCNEDGNIWIVFNGEIYNHAELRKILLGCGHKFKTDHSDTEVIIHAFEQWGEACVDRFRGMFAFCIWDNLKKQLFLFRDRIGIKPLYYTVENGRFIFASEIKSILVDRKIKREVNDLALYNYLSFLTSPPPDTMFKNIYKLPPASYLKVDKSGLHSIKKYWDVLDKVRDLNKEEEMQIPEILLNELKESVRYRSISDVPVGIFLSGGIDSSINAVLFSMLNKNNINTFTIGYSGENQSYKNEFDYARLIAEKINATYHEKLLNVEELIDFLSKMVFYQDEPIADPVCFPIYHVSKLAKDNGVTVCQVGEGSDELFMGYPGWRDLIKIEKLNNIRFTGVFKKLFLNIFKSIKGEDSYTYEWLNRSIQGLPLFWGGAEAFFENEKKLLLNDSFRANFKLYSSFDAIKPFYDSFKNKAPEKTPLNWMSYLDLNFRLPELLLMRVDKMSMAVSLEARVPFLDHNFVELAMSIPQEKKIKNLEMKYILKEAVRGYIPDEIINRPKQGFGVPLYDWFFSGLGDFAREKIGKFVKNTDYFNNDYINKLFDEKKSNKIWYILNFVIWFEKWINAC